jgi:hypothetical protein
VLGKIQGKRNTYILLVGILNSSFIKEASREVPQKLKLELSYDPVQPLMDIYPKESKSAYCRDPCTPMFTVVLCIAEKLWNQPGCPWMDGNFGIHTHTHTHTHTMEYYSVLRKNEIFR